MSLLQEYHPPRSLRSSARLLFPVPTMNSVTYGERAYSSVHLHYGILFPILLKMQTHSRPLNVP